MEQAFGPKLLAHCPLCREVYRSSEIKLLGEKGQARLFHCTCLACGHAVLAVVLESQGTVSSVGLVTDMEVQDALHFQQAKPITTDECIAFHGLLEKDAGGFCRRLLDKKP